MSSAAPAGRAVQSHISVFICAVLGALLAGAGSPASAAPVAPAAGLTVVLHNAETKKCIDVPGKYAAEPDGHVYQSTCDGSLRDNMRWRLNREKGTHSGGYARYTIRHEADNTCLDLPSYEAVRRATPVTTYPCAKDATKDNQVFYAKKTRRGWMFIHDKSKNLCLDVAGFSSRKNGEPLTVWTCDPKGDHDWILKVAPQRVNTQVAMKVSQNVRLRPDSRSRKIGAVRASEHVGLQCYAYGPTSKGQVLWAMVRYTVDSDSEGGVKQGYVQDSTIKTGVNGPLPGIPMGKCPVAWDTPIPPAALEIPPNAWPPTPPLPMCKLSQASLRSVEDTLFLRCRIPAHVQEPADAQSINAPGFGYVRGRAAAPNERACSVPSIVLHNIEVADAPSGVSFRAACEMHDYGYFLIREDYSPMASKVYVDRTFRKVMQASCTRPRPVPLSDRRIKECLVFAEDYYRAVKKFGEKFAL